MNGNTELLQFIYQNAEMGANTIGQILDIVEDEKLKQHLNAQHKEYQDITAEAKTLLQDHGCDEKGISKFDQIKTYLMINLQTLSDKSASHIAEMLIIGSNMGIIDATRKLKKYKDVEKEIRTLMKRLMEFEENNVQRLKEFL